MLRGYAKLKKSGRLGRIMEAQIALVESSLLIQPSRISKKLFGAAAEKANEAVRDFLISRLALHALNKSLLVSLGKKNGKVVYPLPPKWREILISLGWEVSDLKCSFLWAGYLFRCLGNGVVLLVKKLLRGIGTIFNPIEPIKGKYVYFDGLTENELPQGNEGDSYDVISWYLQWSGRNKEIKIIGHNVKGMAPLSRQGVKVQFLDPLLPPTGAVEVLRFLLWGSWAVCLCLLDWCRGRWWSPLMFGPCVQSYIARHQSTYAVDYLFHNSGARKPLWLYEVEANGANSTFYFYSTNNETFQLKKQYEPPTAEFRNLQWCRVLAWNKSQSESLQRACFPKSKIKIVGPIWFSDSGKNISIKGNNIIAVFDVPIRKKEIYASLGVSQEYYSASTSKKFIYDILKASIKKQLKIAIKQKGWRKKSNMIKSHVKLIEVLGKKRNVTLIDPTLSPIKLIKKSSLVISMPYTSTAHFAKHYKKPSCFYDPTGKIHDNDRAAYKIQIISDIKNLEKWISFNIKKYEVLQ